MRLGLIAGNGRFPFLVLDAARGAGHDVTIIAFKEEAFPDLAEAAARPPAGRRPPLGLARTAGHVDQPAEGRRRHPGGDGRAGQAHEALRRHRARPDALGVLMRLKAKNTDAIISAVADVLARPRHRPARLDDVSRAAAGPRRRADAPARRPTTSRPISSSATASPTAIAGLDIGQTIAVKSAAVVAVEAMEGTDAVIARAGQLAGRGVRIVKVAKPNQDMRFDVPVVGVSTIEAMKAAGATRPVGGCRQDADDRRRRDHQGRGRSGHRDRRTVRTRTPESARVHAASRSPSSASGISAGITRGSCRRCPASSSSPSSTRIARAPRRSPAANGTVALLRRPRSRRARSTR